MSNTEVGEGMSEVSIVAFLESGLKNYLFGSELYIYQFCCLTNVVNVKDDGEAFKNVI